MFPVFLAADPSPAPEGSAISALLQLGLPILVFGVLIYFMFLRPEKKRKTNEAKMLNELVVGDQIITKGGVMGRIVSIKDDTITIESGADRTRIQFLRSAISSVTSQISDK